ncbi:MAG: hypothetical protein ACJ75P_09825 [Gaiellaceae bacterium]
MLVSTADLGDGLSTVISRSEIEAALATEGEPIELVLDVTRLSDGEAGESSSVAVSWERFDLERMLEQATSENIALTFDRDALWQAIATDVEAHGMREAVVTLAVAATVAAGAAGQASAYPSSAFGDSSSAPAAQVTGDLAPDDRATPRPTPIVASTPDLAPDDRAVPRPTPIVASTPDLAPDDRAIPRPTPVAAPAPDLAPDDRAVPRPTPVAATPVAATPIATSAPDLAPDDRATPRPTPVSAPVSGTVSDGTSWAPTPTETALLAGAIALAISGAFFLVGGRRVRPRPA